MSYQLTIGLEIHLKIKSPNKLFCQCPNEQNFDTLLPNTNICPTCTGQPGALPTLSYEPLFKALLLGKALNCKINPISTFDRKSYFYPDLPNGYQITQLYNPTNIDGEVTFYIDDNFSIEKTVGIRDAHIENDTAKMIHIENQTLIDFNRAGTPLVEIVTQPDFRSAEEVSAFIKELQKRAKYNDISDADMEKGQMRVDVNISIRKSENDPYGTRVELKNINTTGMVRRAITNEYERQVQILQNGGKIDQETRKRDDQLGQSFSMRSKENALDYRYFPEPDLPPLQIDAETRKKLDETSLEIPHNLIKKFKEDYGFHKEYINTLVNQKPILDYFFTTMSLRAKGNDSVAISLKAKTIAKRISGPISAYLKENFIEIDKLPFSQTQFLDFITIALDGNILDNQLKEIMDEMLSTGNNPDQIILQKGFSSTPTSYLDLDSIIKKTLDTNHDAVSKYKSGKTSVIGFLLGQIMKETQGKVDPKELTPKVEKLLS